MKGAVLFLALLVCLTIASSTSVSAAKVPTPSQFGYSREIYKADDWVGLLNCANTATKFWYSMEAIIFNAKNETMATQVQLLNALAEEYFYADTTRFLLTLPQPGFIITLDTTKLTFATILGRLLPLDEAEHHVGSPAAFEISETSGGDTLYVTDWNDQARVRGPGAPMVGGDALTESRKQAKCIEAKQRGSKVKVMYIYEMTVSARSKTAEGKTIYNELGVVIPRPQS